MASEKQEMSLTLILAIMGIVIINMTIGILHIIRLLIWEQMNVWGTLPIVIGALTLFMSWQILQLVNSHLINFGFQLGGLWAVTTFILDFFLYILPRPGSATDSLAQLSSYLLTHYGIILSIPTVIGIFHSIRRKVKNE